MAPRAGAFTTLVTTNTGAASLVVGGATGGATTGTGRIQAGSIALSAGMALSGGTMSTAGIVIPSAVPSVTTLALYNDSGTLKWNGATVAVGGSVSGTLGKICKFTAADAVGDSIMSESGTTISLAGTLDATTSLLIGGLNINTAGTLSNVAYKDASNIFTSSSGQRFAAGIATSSGAQSTHGIMIPSGTPAVGTTILYNDTGVLNWTGGGLTCVGPISTTYTGGAQLIITEGLGDQFSIEVGTTGTATFTTTTSGGGGKIVMAPTSSFEVTGSASTSLTGALSVTGAATLNSTLAVTSTSALGGAVTITTGTTTTGAVINVNTAEPTVVVNDIIGRVNFTAASDTAGSDANLLAASVVAIAEGTFSSTSNATTLSFRTAASEAATEKMKITSAGVVTITNLATGSLTSASGVITSSSDARLKQDIARYTVGLPEVLKLTPSMYRWNEKSGIPMDRTHVGFIAQDVEACMPLAVSYDGADGMLGLSDRAILAAVVNAIQTLNDRIEKSA